jgi:hypothetical protein
MNLYLEGLWRRDYNLVNRILRAVHTLRPTCPSQKAKKLLAVRALTLVHWT